MSKIIVLGGCGVVGSVAVKTLASLPDFSEIVIGDINIELADDIINALGSDKLTAIRVNAKDSESLKDAIKDSDIVLNCVGPFYTFAPIILQAAIESEKNYVDVCDDVDATTAILKMDNAAKKANISALIGMGSSPGVTNILAKFAAVDLLDEVEEIDLYHAHGGEPVEGPAVIAHRFHAMMIDIPVFVDGQLKTARFFEESGRALEEEVDFAKLGTFKVSPYPHPETITLPKYIPGVRRVTNKGTVLPPEYFELTSEMVRLGLASDEPLNIQGTAIAPMDFAIAYLINQREKILKQTDFGIQRGCVKIVVQGKLKGKSHQFVFSLASQGQALGEGTGIPAALGAVLMKRGRIKEKGVLPPEACINPSDFLTIIQEVPGLERMGEKDSPLLLESIDDKGNVEQLAL
ncbi:MAG: saccharopine dehydrogenase family protein [Candidatus Hodarchaeales archaeon]